MYMYIHRISGQLKLEKEIELHKHKEDKIIQIYMQIKKRILYIYIYMYIQIDIQTPLNGCAGGWLELHDHGEQGRVDVPDRGEDEHDEGNAYKLIIFVSADMMAEILI